jgi:parallel beta-helix repeat protein
MGVEISESEYNKISDNIITCSIGIFISFGKNNNISKNIIKDCNTGIDLIWYSNNNTIIRNNLINNTWGISTGSFHINDEISFNNISNSYYGLLALNCFNYEITNNNFINNFVNARFGYLFIGVFTFGLEFKSVRYIRSTIKWDGNYWDRSRNIPKPILGRMGPSGCIPWIHIDRNPAEEPNDI